MSSLPFKVKAIYEYTSPHEDDLHFPNGQIITVTEEEDDDWYMGEYVDTSGVKQDGIFPKNFVEKYEPTAPPRPNRASRVPKKEAEPALAPPPEPAPAVEPEPEVELEELPATPVARDAPPPVPQTIASPPMPSTAEISPPPAAPKPAPASLKPSPPSPISEKPSGGSFRDRIAAFNKAAPPPVPFKLGGLSSRGSNNFIKKPFVAPPPSKNAYVPVPREAPPAKIYRREEDPEIAAKESQNLEQAEKAGLVPSTDAEAEEQPKPTSLKERIALLQKQQMEQANRHAEAAQKKEKPKKPVKKRTDSYVAPEGVQEEGGAPLERRDTEETIRKPSIDSKTEEVTAPRRRKSSKGAVITPGLPPRQSFGDGNEADLSGAGDTTEGPEDMSAGRDDSDEKPKSMGHPPLAQTPFASTRQPDVGDVEEPSEEGAEGEEGEEEEEEEEIDPEVRRKEELRARMAKMSGGMGMHGMFAPPLGMPMPGMVVPKKKKSTGTSEKRSGEYGAEDVSHHTTSAPPVPMVPMLAIPRVLSPEELNKQVEQDDERAPVSSTQQADEVPDTENLVPSQETGPPPSVPPRDYRAPPVPGGRPAPPPIPTESRPAVPLSMPMSPSAGSESDDELSVQTQKLSMTTDVTQPPPRPLGVPGSPSSPNTKRASFFGNEQGSPSSPTTPVLSSNKRTSRLPPPIPGNPNVSSPQSRAPPPPPPTAPLSRSSTGDQNIQPSSIHPTQEASDEEEITEYEGDYDTDIASAVPHKDALKSHARESNLEDETLNRSPPMSPTSAPPPLPLGSAPRSVPPPLLSQSRPSTRQSADMPRAAPPPPPAVKIPAPLDQDDDEYDPYKYTSPRQAVASVGALTPKVETNEEDIYSASPPKSFVSPPPRDAAPAPANRPAHRQSVDVHRPGTTSRRSMDLGRLSMDSGYVANDVDLAKSTFWWAQPNGIPPIFQNRKDILYESEESTSSRRGGKTTITKDLYVLFQDYSQTIITAQFAAQDPADVQLSQRHEPPPSRLRQDQLEEAYEQCGRRLSEAAASKKETVVGDGTPQGLIQELLKPFADALLPIGTRAYGAIVYGNLANASTQQNDEIRPGDIITLRKTKFQGKHGPMHAKYSVEIGKPDHVGVVAEWDGTKKKVRTWEQGRESRKVKLESFKLDDLRSGEVKIWRVMPRSWVGWQGRN